MARRQVWLLIAAMVMVWSGVGLGATVYVDCDAPSTPHDGSDWDHAYLTISAGISGASSGDTVMVAAGTYVETLDFDGKAITVQSADPDDWDAVEATILDADEETTAVLFNSGEGSGSKLMGFTIVGYETNGIYCSSSSPEIGKCIIGETGNEGERGIRCDNGSPVIANCELVENLDYGIMITGSSMNPTIQNCVIRGSYYGIYEAYTSAATLSNLTIVKNYYGILCDNSSTTVTNCILWGNTTDDLLGVSATYSCIEDGDSGTGNISSNPVFEDYTNNDFHLTENSPCIDGGDPNGTYTGQTDIDGENREMDDQADMGADEHDG